MPPSQRQILNFKLSNGQLLFYVRHKQSTQVEIYVSTSLEFFNWKIKSEIRKLIAIELIINKVPIKNSLAIQSQCGVYVLSHCHRRIDFSFFLDLNKTGKTSLQESISNLNSKLTDLSMVPKIKLGWIVLFTIRFDKKMNNKSESDVQSESEYDKSNPPTNWFLVKCWCKGKIIWHDLVISDSHVKLLFVQIVSTNHFIWKC